MFLTILHSVLRQIQRQPLYVGLNVLGLGLGIGVFLTLVLLVRYDYGYNAGLRDVDRLVRVDARISMPGNAPAEYEAVTFRGVPFLKEDFPEIEDSVRVTGAGLDVRRNGTFLNFDAAYVDPSFLRIFGLTLEEGTEEALSRPNGLVLSEEAARRLFGTTHVLGRPLTVNDAGSSLSYVVTGIMRPVSGPNFLSGMDMVVPISERVMQTRPCFWDWGSDCGSLYLKFRHASDIAAAGSRLRDFIMRRATGVKDDDMSLGPHPEQNFALQFVKLREARFHDAQVTYASHAADRNVVNGIGLVGVLALVLACANAVNLATARSVLRAREVAIRKTLGATRHVLFGQFVGEAVLLSAISAAFGLALSEILLPIAASLTGESLRMPYGFVLTILPCLILGSGIASGLYPALILSGYRPADILAATRMPSGGRPAARLRDALVVGQFTIAVTIVIGMLVIQSQTQFLRHADRGYVSSGVLVGNTIPRMDFAMERRMRDALRHVPGVQSVALGLLSPHPDDKTRSTFTYDGPHGPVRVHFLQDTVDGGYRDVYRPRVLAGRWFDPSHGEDEMPERSPASTRVTNVVLNVSGTTRLGFAVPADAIDKILTIGPKQFRIIGVIADMRFESPRQPVYPEVIAFNTLATRPFYDPIPAIRFADIPVTDMKQRLRQAWSAVLPDVDGTFETADGRMENYYRTDEQRGHIFTLGAAAAIAIACLGLYGLSSFAAARRVHEIGIRKTLGATAFQIVLLLLRDFLRPVGLACLIACPIGWVLMRNWLSGFDERIALGPVPFVVAVGGALAISLLTTLAQTLRLARTAPACALRGE